MYPRHDDRGELVTDAQLVGSREHLSREHRVVFLTGVLTGETESHNALIALDSLGDAPIKLIITSQGGDMDAAFLFYDTMRLLQSPVETLGRYAASAAALLLTAGNKRYLLPHSKVMLHLPSGQMSGDARDWEIQHTEMVGYKNRMVDLLIECGVARSREEILRDIDREKWMGPKEAIDYGLADEIMDKEAMKRWLS